MIEIKKVQVLYYILQYMIYKITTFWYTRKPATFLTVPFQEYCLHNVTLLINY